MHATSTAIHINMKYVLSHRYESVILKAAPLSELYKKTHINPVEQYIESLILSAMKLSNNILIIIYNVINISVINAIDNMSAALYVSLYKCKIGTIIHNTGKNLGRLGI